MRLATKKSNILIVDDTPENLTVLRQMLKEHGYLVRPALSGEIALKAAQANIPDLVLLDIMMPGMDGFEICERLKQDEETRNIPIIFISALHETENKVKAFSTGGVDYITKPFQVEEVLARVKTHLTIHRLQQHLEEKNDTLQKALDEIKTLQGIVPICSWCKDIRDDEGFWKQVEVYFAERSDAKFSHGICPDCMKKHYPDICPK